jgi:hypothetical protein
LENQLGSQRELVAGGVVLGQTITVPEDTRALLRQLLTSTDRQGVLGQMQANLGSVEPLVAALLALIGFGAAARVGRDLKPQVVVLGHQVAGLGHQVTERTGQQLQGWRSIMVNVLSRRGHERQTATPAGDDWRTALGDNRNVIVWLRSGTKVSGIANKWYPADADQGKDRADVSTITILRLDDVTYTREGDPPERAEFVWVPVEDIAMIAKSPPAQATSST